MPVALLHLVSALLLAAATPAQAGGEEPLGRPSAIELASPAERVVAPAGARLHREPDAQSLTLLVFDVDVELEVLARRGPWVRVRHESWIGWLAPTGEPPAPAPAATATEAPAAPAVPDASAERLASALARLVPQPATGRLGPFALHTDVEDARRLAWLQRVAELLPAAYGERFRLAPPAAPGGTVVLFDELADYEAFARHAEGVELPVTRGVVLAGTASVFERSDGHAASGIAALYAGGEDRAAATAVLVHELAHLLNRAAFGRPLPTWLEEALANDLSWSEIDGDGRLRLGSAGGSTRVTPPQRGSGAVLVERQGAQASRRLLLAAWKERRLPRLPAVLAMSWKEFVAPPGRSLHYALSTELVRLLLDGDPQRAAGFRAFLAEVAGGAEPSIDLLEQRVGDSVAALQRELELQLTRQLALLQ